MDAIEAVKKLHWYHWVERHYSPFWALFWAGVDKKYFDRIGLKGFGYDTNFYQYPMHYQSYELSLKNKKFTAKWLKKHSIFQISKELEDFHKKALKEIQKLIKNKENTLKKLYEMQEVFRPYCAFCWITEPLEKYYQEKINKLVPKYVKGDINKWVGDISVPKKKNVYALLQDELRRSVPLEEVLAKYGWSKSRDGFSDFYTLEDLKEIKNHLKGHTEAAPKVAVPKKLKNLVEELKELTFLRTDRTDKLYEMAGAARPILQEVAKYMGVSFNELQNYDCQSILQGKPKRIGFPFTYAYHNGEEVLLKEKIINFETEKKEEISGIIAFAGKASGQAKIVKHPDELRKVNAGDVLVAQSTFPSFISAMHKAVAFVTDEGGITSHAAIISREMKKPCIVGTKNATKVLRDGDLVEVNADKGIVKIIK